MKKIWSYLRQDFTTALRDNIVLYTILAPLLVAVLLKAFLPSVEEAGLHFAVEREVGDAVVASLEQYGSVELYDHAAAVVDRVERPDTVAGIVSGNGSLRLIFEGDEEPGIMESFEAVTAKVAAGYDLVELTTISVSEADSLLNQILFAALIMMAALIGGTVAGFNIVDEKESRAIQAAAVTPLRLSHYITARGLLSVITGGIITLGTGLILAGSDINYGLLLLLIAFSGFVITAIGLAVGGTANNQITAIASLKVIMPVYMTIPIVTIFVSEKYQYLFYILPNYWQFQAVREVFFPGSTGYGFWLPAWLTLVLGAVFLAVIVKVFRRRFQIR